MDLNWGNGKWIDVFEDHRIPISYQARPSILDVSCKSKNYILGIRKNVVIHMSEGAELIIWSKR